jgi:hypothetical protein
MTISRKAESKCKIVCLHMLRGAADCQQSTNKTQIDDLRISNCERAMKIVLAIVRFCDKPTFDT